MHKTLPFKQITDYFPSLFNFEINLKDRISDSIGIHKETILVSEDVIIQKLQKRPDKSLFGMLIEPHLQYGYRVVFRVLMNKEDSEDVLQNALVKVLENIKKFRKESSFKTWFSNICYNEALQFIRKRKKIEGQVQVEQAYFISDNSMIADECVKKNEEEQQMMSLVRDLAPKQRLILIKFYKDELSVKEIAEELGESASVVKVTLHRARKKLKAEFKGS